MNAINEISLYLLQTAIGIYLLIMLMRFVLQLVLADFYNPISQFLVRATNPLVLPLRRILPARGRIDFASLALAIAIQLLGIIAILAMNGFSLPGPSLLVAWSVVAVIGLLVKIYFFALLGMIILSWIAPGTSNPAAYLMYQITEPVMAPFRRMLPAMGGIDFSPILLFILINIIQIALRNFAGGLGLHPALVMGI
ncbi:MAG: YggT family protein [Kangiellaceae bacterium]|jgi:YggT family protein|nr:YggT family protein [Kangiellaceae bacterium]